VSSDTRVKLILVRFLCIISISYERTNQNGFNQVMNNRPIYELREGRLQPRCATFSIWLRLLSFVIVMGVLLPFMYDVYYLFVYRILKCL